MKIFKKILCFTLSLLLIISVVGCGESDSSAIIYYGVTEVPKTIDPQKAASSAELMVVRNIFEGLLRKNTNGEIVNGVIEGYKKEGLTYTFNLKPDAVWADGTPLTADDFVFGFRRAVLPETASDYAKSLYCIKNAKAINENSADSKTLGITAENASTIKIQLEYDDPDFESTLTTAICMPCNKDFFEKSIGKYGMSGETILCNGSYTLKKWSTTDFAMRIAKNPKYSGDFNPKNAAVYFSKNKELNNLQCLDKNYVDIAALDVSLANSAKDKGYGVSSVKNKVIVMSVGADFPPEMRKSLFLCGVSESDFSGEDLQIAKTVYPEMINAGKISEFNLYDPNTAGKIFYEQYKLLDLKEFPQTAITFLNDEKTEQVAKAVAGHWQQYLGVYINVKSVASSDELSYYEQSQKYPITMHSLEITHSNTEDYLRKIGAEKAENLQKTQDKIISAYSSLPIAFASSYYAYSKELSNVHLFNDNGIFDFSQIIKED